MSETAVNKPEAREIVGTSDQVLEVDLSARSWRVYKVTQRERVLYLGAKGLGLKLLYDRLPRPCDPLSPESIIAFMPGVLMGTGAPCSGRFEALGLSPLTGIMTCSSCGGPFGMALKTAGWDGLLITGKAQEPTWLEVTAEGVEFHDAGELWGLEIPPAQEQLTGKRRGAVVIGPAGENLVPLANIGSGHRFLGRGGLGAVMGSKGLKAVVAQGGAARIRPARPARFEKVKKRATAYINRNQITSGSYRSYGTLANLRMSQEGNILPVRNFSDGQHQDFDRLSGETLAQEHNTKHHTCKPCTILCGHEGDFQVGRVAVPEYETTGLMGSSLGVFDAEALARWNARCGALGMDTISVGGTLAWVMEAAEKGLVESELSFGSTEGVDQALEDMAQGRGFGAEMARGSRELASRYGGRSFAMHVKGLEMAAYDPRGSFGLGLAYAVANRGGCHLSAYLVAQEVYLHLLKPDSAFGKAQWVKFFEDLTACINSLQTCHFTMYAYVLESPLAKLTPDLLLGQLMQWLPWVAIPLVDYSIYVGLWTSVTGLSMSRGEFLAAGERAHVLERLINTNQGVDRNDDTLPARLLDTARASDPRGLTVPLDRMLPAYYKLRGYDQDGIPTQATLRRLQIA